MLVYLYKHAPASCITYGINLQSNGNNRRAHLFYVNAKCEQAVSMVV
jgi:hypothetical protein